MSILDTIGPIIIGPSSSHTAGAIKIGKFAYNYIGKIPDKVDFILHGSFADTYIGHGSDRALLGGVMGFRVDDIRIKNAYKYAEKFNLKYNFIKEDLGEVHPNTVKIIARSNNDLFKLTASSIGAGEIEINEIDEIEVKINGKTPSLVIINKDKRGVLNEIFTIINNYDINVANVHLKRLSRVLKEAICIIELDENPNLLMIRELQKNENIIRCTYIPSI